jgi:hypothetical protein
MTDVEPGRPLTRRALPAATCARCIHPAVVLIAAGSATLSRSAAACAKHRAAVEKWAGIAGRVRVTPVHQPEPAPPAVVQDTLFDLDGGTP